MKQYNIKIEITSKRHILPKITELSLMPGSGPVGANFSCSVSTVAHPPARVSYEWRLDGRTIPGATGADHFADTTGLLSVVVTATNNLGTTTKESAPALVTATGAAPRISRVAVSPGSGLVGDSFAAIAEADGEPEPELAYQWMLDGKPISGATSGSHHTTAEGDLSVVVTAANSLGTDSRESATAAVAAAPVAPTNTEKPIIAGVPEVGETLTSSDGTWIGIPTPFLARNWQRNGADIAGETGGSYVVRSEDSGAGIRLRVTATNSEGPATAHSVAVSVPALAPEAWTPEALPALFAWLEASDADTEAPVAEWHSRVGTAAAVQSDAARQPVRGEEAGRAVIRFDGVDDALSIMGAPQPATGLSIVMSARTRVNNVGIPVNYASNFNGANGEWILGPLGGFKSRLLVRADNNNNAVTVGGAADTGFHIIGGSSKNGVTSAFCDGLVGTPVVHSTPAASIRQVQLGSRIGAGFSPIDICEAVVVSDAIAGADRLRLEGYLAHRWELAGLLPADHPFKDRPPLIGEDVADPGDPVAPPPPPWVQAGSLQTVSAPATVYVAPGATHAHIPLTASGPIRFTAWARARALQNISGGGFNVGNAAAQKAWLPPYDYFWRDGDDLVHWVTITIDASESVRKTIGNKFQVNWGGMGWTNAHSGAQAIPPTVIEVQSGAVNDLPAQMPYHRPPKRLHVTGTPSAALDPATFAISRTGWVGNPTLAAGTLNPLDPRGQIPCWRSRYPHGYTPPNAGEMGLATDLDGEFAAHAINPHSTGSDEHGSYIRLHTVRFPEPVTTGTTTYQFQAPVMTAQTMPEWWGVSGLWRARCRVPGREGAWSIFWTQGVTKSTRSGNWPPEIDFFEHFNGAYGMGANLQDWNMSGKLQNLAQHAGNYGSNVRARAEGLRLYLDGLGFDSAVNVYTQPHEYACAVAGERVYWFFNGIELYSAPYMSQHQDDTKNDWAHFPIMSVSVKTPNGTSDPYTGQYPGDYDDSGDLLIYQMERYEMGEYALVDHVDPRPWPAAS
jgi:hypothetical protein